MSSTHCVLEQMLRRGEVILHVRPALSEAELPAIVDFLRSAYEEHRLTIAGPLLPFDSKAALAGAMFLLQSCWLLVSNNESAADIEKAVELPLNPNCPEAHLSADLCLRLLTTVYLRVRMRPPEDALHRGIVGVLRRWPLSGVRSGVADPPLGDTEFHNHPGLQLLYAERLSAALRPSWIPRAGRTREVVELVLQQQGKTLPEPPEREGGD